MPCLPGRCNRKVIMKYDVFCGLDVGKESHHGTGLNGEGDKLVDRVVANNETALRALYEQLRSVGELLVVVDQPSSIGSLPIAVARAMGIDVAYLPGLSMRRIADLHPGNAKTDARDAFIIADAARTMPHTLRQVDLDDAELAELEVLVGHDDDLAAQSTAVVNRIRGLLLQIHPTLERAIGENASHPGVLDLLARFGGPTGLRAAGQVKIRNTVKKNAPRMGDRLAADIWTALGQQTVIIPGTTASEKVLTRLADQLHTLRAQRKQVATEIEEALDALPLSRVLTSMPGVGVRTAARILVEIGDASNFPTAGHLAAYAGIAPVTRRSGTSIKGEFPSRSGNKNLKNAFFMSAFASLRADPVSRAYYDRKRAEGKKHNTAIICLARRRSDVIYAMLRDRREYQPPQPAAA
jgi:transposase